MSNKKEQINSHLSIKKALKDAGMTQGELAEKVGVTRVSIYRVLNGLSYPRADLVKKIADALHLHPSELFEWESDYPSPEEKMKSHALEQFKQLLDVIEDTHAVNGNPAFKEIMESNSILKAMLISPDFMSLDEEGMHSMVQFAKSFSKMSVDEEDAIVERLNNLPDDD